jgi:hypothetical protein
MEKPYGALAPLIATFGGRLPQHLHALHMHLDPDFDYLTYGDQGERAKQLKANLGGGDLLVFYASLADVRTKALVYAIIGLYVVEDIRLATELPQIERRTNAHTRRELQSGAQDLVVRTCRRFGSFRVAYRSAIIEIRPIASGLTFGRAGWIVGEGRLLAAQRALAAISRPGTFSELV